MSTAAETIEGEFREVEPNGSALAVRANAAIATAWTPSFVVPVDEMVQRVEAKHQFYQRVMKVDQHYGKIPGAGDKPALLKPGAELLLSAMGLYAEFDDADTPVCDYGDGKTEGLVRYRRRCSVYRQVGDLRVLIAKAEGSCSSRESKYRWRTLERACPKCGANAIKVSKFDDGGFYCFGKIGGCGARFPKGDPAIEGQTTGRIANPDLADVENTILKMADKRALVAAALIATGCSDIFTQDVEDNAPDAGYEDPPPSQTPQPQTPQRGAATRTDRVRDRVQNAPSAAPATGAATQPANGQRSIRQKADEAAELVTVLGIVGEERKALCVAAIGRATLGRDPSHAELDALLDALYQVRDARSERGIDRDVDDAAARDADDAEAAVSPVERVADEQTVAQVVESVTGQAPVTVVDRSGDDQKPATAKMRAALQKRCDTLAIPVEERQSFYMGACGKPTTLVMNQGDVRAVNERLDVLAAAEAKL